MNQQYVARCQWCGKTTGRRVNGSPSGEPPIDTPFIPGNCPSHPSGKKDCPHAPKWEKA